MIAAMQAQAVPRHAPEDACHGTTSLISNEDGAIAVWFLHMLHSVSHRMMPATTR